MKEVFVGKKFGRVTVIGDAPYYVQPNGSVKRQVVGRCDCGVEKVFRSFDLKSGNTTSCGCLKVELAGTHTLRHGGAINGKHTRTYKCWCHLRDRCSNPNNKDYRNYGGRGIRVCARWLGREGFINFLSDMGERPIGKTIERMNNNGNYEPGNCRWATKIEQGNNTRKNVFIEYDGKRKTAAEWEREMGLPPEVIAVRIRKGQSPHVAITTPLRKWPGPVHP